MEILLDEISTNMSNYRNKQLDKGAKNAVIWTTNFLNPEKFPQTASRRLDLSSCLFVAPSCKLVLARFSALLRIQDGAECGNNKILSIFPHYVYCNNDILDSTLDYMAVSTNTMACL